MDNPLLNVGNKFRSRFKTIHGVEFYGQILDIPDTARVSNFLTARRYLRTGPSTPIRPGNVIVANGVTYIVGEHGDGFYVQPIYKHFKLFEVSLIASWFRKTETTHVVTGVKEYSRDVFYKDVYLSTQPLTSAKDQLRIPLETMFAVSNEAISVDDKVDDYIVTKSDRILGVTLLELKRL